MNNKAVKITIIVLSAILVLLVVAAIIMYRQRYEPDEAELPSDIVEDTPVPVHERVEIEKITIVVESTEISKGTRFLPELIILPLNATDKLVELRSDNERVIRQQGHNWVAVEVGTANIIATATNGVTSTIEITVLPPDLEEIVLHEDDITIEIGNIYALTPEFIPSDAGLVESIQYNTNNESVAEVSSDGRIRAVGPGNAIITVSVGDIIA